MKLTLIEGISPDREVFRDVTESAQSAKDFGLISDFEVLSVPKGHFPRVDARTGSVEFIGRREAPRAFHLLRNLDKEWEE
jgi:hypothetical protein